jgi:Predicted secreted protein
LKKRYLGFVLSRRDLVRGAGATLAALAMPRAATAEGPSERSPGYEAAFKEIVGDKVPELELITMELPEHAENGNIVPYKLSVESPMTEQDYINKLHLLSTANPNAKVATFRFTPHCGKAIVTGRMRLAKTQDVVCVAETSSGNFVMGSTRVEVTIGGCLN